MKLYSRLSGEPFIIEQGQEIQSGLYTLMDRKQSDKLMALFNIGSGKQQSAQVSFTFSSFEKQQTSKDGNDIGAALTITHDAIEHINSKYQSKQVTEFSHLLPPEIAQLIATSDLDKKIKNGFADGIFQTINQSPRMSMRYDVELLATSRVKRYASNYQTHLVAHSECWQQRTFTGIIPKKLMAKVSEDEINIYENIVYARLIDYLLRYLAGAQARLQHILDVIEKFEKLDAQGKVHHYVTQITKDWGRAFSESDVGLLKKESQQHMDYVKEYRAKLTQMKNGELYQKIPKNIQIGLSLKATNILNHDDNYRRLAAIWRTWSNSSLKERLNPAQVLTQKLDRQRQYSTYIAMTIQQIFGDIGLQVKVDEHQRMRKICISRALDIDFFWLEEGVWCLKYNNQIICRIVALSELWCNSDIENQALTDKSPTYPIILATPKNLSNQKNNRIVELSPLTLLGKETLASLLVQSIWQWALSIFVQPLPKNISVHIKNKLNGNDLITKPLTKEQLDFVNKSARDELAETIRIKSAISDFIRCCPYCTQQADEHSFGVNDNGDFKGKCNSKECQSEWVHNPKQPTYFRLNDGSGFDGRYSFALTRA